MRAKLGLWGPSDAVTPWAWRKGDTVKALRHRNGYALKKAQVAKNSK